MSLLRRVSGKEQNSGIGKFSAVLGVICFACLGVHTSTVMATRMDNSGFFTELNSFTCSGNNPKQRLRLGQEIWDDVCGGDHCIESDAAMVVVSHGNNTVTVHAGYPGKSMTFTCDANHNWTWNASEKDDFCKYKCAQNEGYACCLTGHYDDQVSSDYQNCTESDFSSDKCTMFGSKAQL